MMLVIASKIAIIPGFSQSTTVFTEFIKNYAASKKLQSVIVLSVKTFY